MDPTQRLHETIAAVCPITGVAIVDATTTPPTVDIYFAPEATPEQINAAYAALDAFDWSEQAQAQWEEEKRSLVAGATNVALMLADLSTDLDVYEDVPELTFQLAAGGRYLFEFRGTYTAEAATVGMHLMLAGPAFSSLTVTYQVFTTASSFLLAVGHAYEPGVTPSSSGGATELPFVISGNLNAAEAGALSLKMRSERAGDLVTLKQGTCATLQALASSGGA